ncbi:peptidase U34 [Blastomyces gilchristii SLH14081]|uniref:Peptidase U34 n=1 Tax=Blastomyces gilchristii (strain SLH14081) TaxID=559298 RepID=A0A179UEC0_BLAGS|nr:peptidase U34 [Blastomyces gilchristii SLH14081]OAT05361.1 peptidase U34 [Blastomyces gilchristii SLH14081]
MTIAIPLIKGQGSSADGGMLIGGTGEEVSNHWVQLFPREIMHPTSLSEWSHRMPRFLGRFPPPSTNGGINEKGVEVRDIWASNDDELVKMTPTPQHGVQYSNLARLVMERASTAREGVELFGNLIKERGYATYGGNSHLIADCNKGSACYTQVALKIFPSTLPTVMTVWVLKLSFHLPLNKVGGILVATDPSISSTSMTSRGPITRPATAGLSTSPKRSWRIQLSLWSLLANKIQSSVFADDQASYGQVLSLKQGVHPDLLRIWIAPTASVAAPHVPYWLRVNSILPEFGQHRYLYDGASSTFLNPDFMLQQASQFAGRLFKRVLYYMCSNPKVFLPIDRYVDGIRGVVTERHWLGRTE